MGEGAKVPSDGPLGEGNHAANPFIPRPLSAFLCRVCRFSYKTSEKETKEEPKKKARAASVGLETHQVVYAVGGTNSFVSSFEHVSARLGIL